MIRTSRNPGNFAHSSMGRAEYSLTGWRTFRFGDSEVVTENPRSVCTITETATTTVATFATSHSMLINKSPMFGYVAAIPLRTPEGRLLAFGDPFTLKTRLELISISGDSTATTEASQTDKSKPQILVGICANASDFDGTTNEHHAMGWRNKAISSSGHAIDRTPVIIYSELESDGTGITLNNITSGVSTGTNIFETDFNIGPDVDANNNAHISFQVFADSGDDFSTANGGSHGFKTDLLVENQTFSSATGQVYLFCAVSDCNEVDSVSSACVVTFRVTYMVEGDPVNGWGTS